MRIVIYRCDHCGEVLSDSKNSKPHISLDLRYGYDSHNGWYEKKSGNWCVSKRVTGVKQFCNGDCLGSYFDKLSGNLVVNNWKEKDFEPILHKKIIDYINSINK